MKSYLSQGPGLSPAQKSDTSLVSSLYILEAVLHFRSVLHKAAVAAHHLTLPLMLWYCNHECQETSKRTGVTLHQAPMEEVFSISSQFHKKIYLLNECSHPGGSTTSHKGCSVVATHQPGVKIYTNNLSTSHEGCSIAPQHIFLCSDDILQWPDINDITSEDDSGSWEILI